jgi:phage-related protein
MSFTISFYDERCQADLLSLPKTLLARFVSLSSRMLEHGPHLGEPHTKALGDGLFEMRLKGMEGIARVMYCTVVGRRIVVLHSFVKKTDKIPANEMAIAQKRLTEVKGRS